MVEREDPRVAGLVESLKRFRQVPLTPEQASSEDQCREHAIDPFFKKVAGVVKQHWRVPGGDECRLVVVLGSTTFSGFSDMFFGDSTSCLPPKLNLEFKPHAGTLALKNVPWPKVSFRAKVQAVCQTMALQSLWSDRDDVFYSVLANLNCLFVVRVRSFNGDKLYGGAHSAVSEPTEYVRALLWAIDSNSKLVNQHPPADPSFVICHREQVFPPTVPDPHGHQQPRAGGTGQAGSAPNPAPLPGSLESKLPLRASKEYFRDDFVCAALEAMCPRIPSRRVLQTISQNVPAPVACSDKV
jgi:hypothetical protein